MVTRIAQAWCWGPASPSKHRLSAKFVFKILLVACLSITTVLHCCHVSGPWKLLPNIDFWPRSEVCSWIHPFPPIFPIWFFSPVLSNLGVFRFSVKLPRPFTKSQWPVCWSIWLSQTRLWYLVYFHNFDSGRLTIIETACSSYLF